MKKYIFRIFMIIIFVFAIYSFKSCVYGTVCSGGWTLCNFDYSVFDGITDDTGFKNFGNKSVISKINEYVNTKVQSLYDSYAYFESVYSTVEDYLKDPNKKAHPLTNQLVIHTHIYAWPADSYDRYNVNFGTEGDEQADAGEGYEMGSGILSQCEGLVDPEGRVLWENLKSKLGCPVEKDEMISFGFAEWDAVIVADVPYFSDFPVYSAAAGGEAKRYSITVKAVYTGEDINENDPNQQHGNPIKIYEKGEETLFDTFDQWFSHPIESILDLILGGLKLILGDVPQMVSNIFQTGVSGITFSPEVLETQSKEDVTSPNAYINFARGEVPGDEDKQKFVRIASGLKNTVDEDGNEKNNSYGFSDETEIPLISVDLYTLAANKVDFMDANFLVVNGEKNEVWKNIRNFIASVVHAMMYITSAILFMGIIYNGVMIVKNSAFGESPSDKRRHKEAIEKIGKSLFMLIGTLFIEALCIYASEIFLKDVGNLGKNTYEGPIRVFVTDATYSFSTTPTGYVRYMSDIENLDLLGRKAMYTFVYIVLAWTNLFFTVIMLARMILMMGLAVVAFGCVIYYIFERNGSGMNKYKSWIIMYAVLASIQVMLAIVERIILETAIT